MELNQTKAALATDGRLFRSSLIKLEGMDIKWISHIVYLGMDVYRRLNFRKHMVNAIYKAIESERNISKLMPNVVAPREAKRRFLVYAFHSKLLYAVPVFETVLATCSIRKMLASAKRGVALRIGPIYRTVYIQSQTQQKWQECLLTARTGTWIHK